ncbi:pyridoxamine 5'-phosphate oxidase family protein [Termitidicoccus mucosus]|uniref:5-nitroimidazole antibiotic resistance protein n=1 Tax=Termitidicoccus mucosus TaxID=1184151 RepID=A0A178ID89_9BACT|nr:5-nitroimidazole antibiotic resistance protein [Opitutaceae bacterium TSB47]
MNNPAGTPPASHPHHPDVRRQDRLLDAAGQERLLDTGEYGCLSMNSEAGGYGIPISFVRDGARIYFHCAPVGRKLDILARDSRVSFCVVGKTQVIPHQFTTAYESVIVFGRVATGLPDEERRAALRLLVAKYCPEYKELGETYMEKSFHRTAILRLDIERQTGKAKQMPPRKPPFAG